MGLMIEIPHRRIVSLCTSMVATLECGHELYGVDYADSDVACIECTKVCWDKIHRLRGRVVVKCQRRMKDLVWDMIGPRLRQSDVAEVKFEVGVQLGSEEVPF